MAKVKRTNVLEKIILLFFVVYLILPILAILIFSVSDSWEVGSPLPNSYTLKWYFQSLTNRDLLISIGRSMLISSISVIVGLIIILPTAYIVRCSLNLLEPFVRFFTLFPYVLPGVILALGLIQIYSKPPIPIAGTIYILLFSYVSVGLPSMYFVISNSLQSIDVKSLTEASQSLGAGMIETFFRVIIPNITPGIINASLLTFAGLLG
ncbi:MAG: ABC transporter permease, partial [bacterium]